MRLQEDLKRSWQEARRQTDELFELVRPENLYDRPIPERHRIAFYIGHLEAFDWNLIARKALDVPAFDAVLDRLFAFGIDPPPGELPSDTIYDWPVLRHIEAYRDRVRAGLDPLLDQVSCELQHVAIEHRLMHAETLAYILHQLPHTRKVPPPEALRPGASNETRRPSRFIEIPAGEARLGRTPDEGFGWDNEFMVNTVDVPAFRIHEHKVTNGEYLEFVREGAAPPFFWIERGGEWFYRGMFAEVPLPLDAPVYTTLREAEAYAHRRGARIPTEAQYHRAACGSPAATNLDFRAWDPVSVYADDVDASAVPRQMIGNGWEWTSTPFAPFPGFRPMEFYPNYSEPFFDNQHYVLKGASPRTAAAFLRPSFRNWFRPSYPYVYATFRMVTN